MWDRDLAALSVALDDMDTQEEADERATTNAAEGRKRKRGVKGGCATGSPPVSVTRRSGRTAAVVAADEKLFDKPLIESARQFLETMEVSKTSWGNGENTLIQEAEVPPELPDDQDTAQADSGLAVSTQGALCTSGGRGRGKGRGREGRRGPARVPQAESEAASTSTQPEQADEDAGGAALLSRLLRRKGPEQTVATGTALPQHAELSGSDDIFSFLRTGFRVNAASLSPPSERLAATLDVNSTPTDDNEKQPLNMPMGAAEAGNRCCGGRGGRGARARGGTQANSSTADEPAVKRPRRKTADDDEDEPEL